MDQTESAQILLERSARLRDRAAMDTLIRRYANLVHGVAFRQTRDSELAADVSQAVFIVFIRRVGSIRNARALPAWFHQTTRLAVKSALRSANRRRAHELRAAKPEPTMIESCLDRAEELSQLDEAVASLGNTDRDVVLMKYFQGWETSVIAGTLGITQETTRKRLSRAVERIREFFARRGTALGVAGVSAILTAAGSHTAPAAVVQAAASASATSAASSAFTSALAKNLTQIIVWSKLKLAACVFGLAMVTALTAGSVALLQQSTPAAVPATRASDPQLEALSQQYTLADDQVLRLVKPPFPPARAVWFAKEFPRIRPSPGCVLGFLVKPYGLKWKYLSMGNQDMDGIVRMGLQLPWHSLSGLDQLSWEPLNADLLVRDGASTRQKLDALAELIRQETGQTVAFNPRKVPRNCLILRGKTSTGPKNRYNQASVAVSLDPLDERLRETMQQGVRIGNFSTESNLEGAGRVFDAPFFAEPGNHGDFTLNSFFLIAPDAHLSASDPAHVSKLKRIAENLRAQIGGEWSVEPREIEVWVMEKVQL